MMTRNEKEPSGKRNCGVAGTEFVEMRNDEAGRLEADDIRLAAVC